MDVEYLSLLEAQAELQRRQKNTSLQEAVERFWADRGGEHPPFPQHISSMALFARQVATARLEDVVFHELARRSGFTPVWGEYHADTWVSLSPMKRSLVHPRRMLGRGRHASNPFRIKKKRLAHMQDCERKQIRDLVGRENGTEVSIVEWHTQAHMRVFGNTNRFDASMFMERFPDGAHAFYPLFLSWFIYHGVLFEDFHNGESGAGLGTFTQDIFMPAYKEVVHALKMKPLIVRMPWEPHMQLYVETEDWRDLGVLDEAWLDALVV